jgi:hypothetical protein
MTLANFPPPTPQTGTPQNPSQNPSQSPSQSSPQFRDRQILCLEQDDQCLYVELVDVIADRNLLWVKPLWLVQVAGDATSAWPSLGPIDDLRGDSDLLWPIDLFRVALDTELLPLLGGPLEGDRKAIPLAEAQRFRSFIRRVWECHRSLFAATPSA